MSRPRRKLVEVIDLEAVSDSDNDSYDSAEDSPGSLVDFIVDDSDDGGFESDETYELSEEDSDSESEAEFSDSDYEEEARKHHCPRCQSLMTPDNPCEY